MCLVYTVKQGCEAGAGAKALFCQIRAGAKALFLSDYSRSQTYGLGFDLKWCFRKTLILKFWSQNKMYTFFRSEPEPWIRSRRFLGAPKPEPSKCDGSVTMLKRYYYFLVFCLCVSNGFLFWQKRIFILNPRKLVWKMCNFFKKCSMCFTLSKKIIYSGAIPRTEPRTLGFPDQCPNHMAILPTEWETIDDIIHKSFLLFPPFVLHNI